MKKIFSNFLVITALLVMVSMTSPVFARVNQIGIATPTPRSIEVKEERRGAEQTAKEVRPNGVNKKQELEEKLLKKRKSALNNLVDKLIKRNRTLKNRIMKNTEIYGDLQGPIISEIDVSVAKLNDLEQRITAATGEELKTLIPELKSYREDINQLKIRRLILLSQINRFEFAIIKKAEDKSSRIAEKIIEFKNVGKDVSKLETFLNEAKAKIVDAKAKLNQLRSEVNVGESSGVKVAEIRKVLNEIKDQIKEVYQLFRKISQEGGGLRPEKSQTQATSTQPTTAQ